MPVKIDVWYGDRQSFGHLGGHPQRWINVLGNIAPVKEVESLGYRLNGSEIHQLSYREAWKRLARPGDFNAEILHTDLTPGRNVILFSAETQSGETITRRVIVDYQPNNNRWPLPYFIDWSNVEHIQDVAQIVDGKWRITRDGIRTVERFYDRVVAFGDDSWSNYEVNTTVTVHALTPPKTDPNKTGVTHAAIATRWPGHDPDGKQPSTRWYPVGATAEFRLGSDLKQCRWRIFDGSSGIRVESERRRKLRFDKPYRMKHRVETMSDGRTRYRVKLWPAGSLEPKAWDLERFEDNDLPSGSALLIAHHSDVTFGNVQVFPVSIINQQPQ